MAQTPDIHSGFESWVEYSRSYFLQRIWTLPTNEANILTNFVAVVLTLATSLLFILCQCMVQLYWSEATVGAKPEVSPASNGTATASEPEDHPNNVGPIWPPNSSSRDGDGTVDGTFNLEGMQGGALSTSANISEGDEQTITNGANGSHTHRNEPEGELNERDSLLSSSARRRNQSKNIIEILMSGETFQGVSLQFFKNAWNEFKSGPETSRIDHIKLWLTWRCFSIRLCLSMVCLGAFVCFTVATIYVAQLASDVTSLSASPDCGKWVLDSSIDILSPFSYMQEMESGNYVRRCYNASLGSDGCNFFFTQNIKYHEKNDACPFATGFCLGDSSPAYTLSTGLVKSQDLGINVPVGYTFNRTSTCAPIQRDGYYSLTEDDLIEYYYGQLFSWADPANLTWRAFPNYPVWTGPGYNVETFCRIPANDPLGWQPIPEFIPQTNNLITLMLITSQRIFYPEYRSDPIFPAEKIHLIGDKFYWLNNDLVSTALACTDHTSICTAAGDVCWDSTAPPAEELPDQAEKDGLYMLQLALQRSSICHSILLRGGAALDASTKLFVYNSLPLAAEEWKVEAQNLFAASLARIQISLRDYVRGSAAKEPGYVDVLEPEHAGMCGRFKFKSVGWTNVSVWGFVVAMLGSLVVFVLAFRVEMPFSVAGDGVGAGMQWTGKADRLVIEILVIWIWRTGKVLLSWFRRGGRWLVVKSNEGMALVKQYQRKWRQGNGLGQVRRPHN